MLALTLLLHNEWMWWHVCFHTVAHISACDHTASSGATGHSWESGANVNKGLLQCHVLSCSAAPVAMHACVCVCVRGKHATEKTYGAHTHSFCPAHESLCPHLSSHRPGSSEGERKRWGGRMRRGVGGWSLKSFMYSTLSAYLGVVSQLWCKVYIYHVCRSVWKQTEQSN